MELLFPCWLHCFREVQCLRCITYTCVVNAIVSTLCMHGLAIKLIFILLPLVPKR